MYVLIFSFVFIDLIIEFLGIFSLGVKWFFRFSIVSFNWSGFGDCRLIGRCLVIDKVVYYWGKVINN